MRVSIPRRGHVVLAAKLALLAGLVAVALRQLDLGAVGDRLTGLDPVMGLAGLGLLLAGQPISALRWRAIAARYGLHATPRWFAVVYLRGCLYNTVLPTGLGGDAVRVAIARRLGSATAAARSVLADRLVGFAALAVTAALVLPLAPAYLPAGWSTPLLGVDSVVLVVGVVLARRRGIPPWLGWTLLYEVVWFAGVWLLAQSLGLALPLAAVPVVVLVVGVAMALPISIGGTGAREAGFVAALAPLGVAAAPAVALGIAFGVALALVGLCGALPVPAHRATAEPRA